LLDRIVILAPQAGTVLKAIFSVGLVPTVHSQHTVVKHFAKNVQMVHLALRLTSFPQRCQDGTD
jgi:hypothetical protein